MPDPSPAHVTFEDRWTMRYVRELAAPVERVWQAVTTSEELNIWLLPVSEVEPRKGGRCAFSWGQPGERAHVSTVSRFEPPWCVRYGQEHGYIQFDLEALEAGTRLTFTHHFDRVFRQEPPADPNDKPGGLPAGPDSPWRPGFVAGYHLSLDWLVRWLAEDWPPPRIAEESAKLVARANAGENFEGDDDGTWARLSATYYDFIRRHCPPAG